MDGPRTPVVARLTSLLGEVGIWPQELRGVKHLRACVRACVVSSRRQSQSQSQIKRGTRETYVNKPKTWETRNTHIFGMSKVPRADPLLPQEQV